MSTNTKATEFFRRGINKNIQPGKRSITEKLMKTNHLRNQRKHSLGNVMKDCDSIVIRVQLSVKPHDAMYITGVIKTLCALFPECPMFFQNNQTMVVFVLPEVPTVFKTMKYRGSFKEQLHYDDIPKSEFIVWGCKKDTFLITIKSSTNEFFFTNLLQHSLLYSNRNVPYEELIKLFVRRTLNAPVISLQTYTVYPLDKYQYALSSSLNLNYGLLSTQNAELAPSGAKFTNKKYSTISAHAQSVDNVHASANAFSSFQNATKLTHSHPVTTNVEETAQSRRSAKDFMIHGVILSQNSVTNNIYRLASAVPVNEASDSLTSISAEQTPFKRRKTLPRYPRYVTESSRHQSYFNWPHAFPTEKECDIAGFFYTGINIFCK
ncbi:hypothetical protein DPMN_055080 [Dreissena polymorpha]|uniref:Uncharacterized protein n=1 Tax=Dreissena polymorpha TaxID=45954 RepID=A0A9D4HQC3_DREPO|nr:hypothetical protein DPMN_055080 [Dreissena polymorpha]